MVYLLCGFIISIIIVAYMEYLIRGILDKKNKYGATYYIPHMTVITLVTIAWPLVLFKMAFLDGSVPKLAKKMAENIQEFHDA